MASATSSSAHSIGKGAKIILLLLGFICLVFCLGGTVTQIQTNESVFMHEPVAMLTPHWQTLLQPYDYVTGNLSNAMSKAFIWSYGSEILYLICIFGFSIALYSVRATWKGFVPVFVFVAILIVGYNIYTDYQYGPTGFWTQAGFALMMQVIVVFFGVIGSGFIEHGFKH